MCDKKLKGLYPTLYRIDASQMHNSPFRIAIVCITVTTLKIIKSNRAEMNFVTLTNKSDCGG